MRTNVTDDYASRVRGCLCASVHMCSYWRVGLKDDDANPIPSLMNDENDGWG